MRLNSTNASSLFAPPAKKGLFASLLDKLLGTQPETPPLPNGPLSPPVPGEDFEVVVPPASNGSSMEIFQHLLTDATTELASRYALLIKLDPSTVFTVREVSIDLSSAPDQFGSDILAMSPDVRNRVITLIMQAAPNAKESLWLKDLFGSTLVADINTVQGQLVTRMAAFSGCRFQVRFKFEGTLISRPEPAPAPTQPAAPEPKNPSRVPQDDVASPDSPKNENIGINETPLPPPKNKNLGIAETPLPPVKQKPANQPVALLCLRSCGQEVSIPLMANGFPYTVGRHDSFKGYSVQSRHDNQLAPLLAQAEPAGFTSFASRGHLVLESFDAYTQQFRVIASNGKNGTFFKNQTMPDLFLLPLSQMAQGDWLRLGGDSSDGIVEVRMEAV